MIIVKRINFSLFIYWFTSASRESNSCFIFIFFLYFNYILKYLAIFFFPFYFGCFVAVIIIIILFFGFFEPAPRTLHPAVRTPHPDPAFSEHPIKTDKIVLNISSLIRRARPWGALAPSLEMRKFCWY